MYAGSGLINVIVVVLSLEDTYMYLSSSDRTTTITIYSVCSVTLVTCYTRGFFAIHPSGEGKGYLLVLFNRASCWFRSRMPATGNSAGPVVGPLLQGQLLV